MKNIWICDSCAADAVRRGIIRPTSEQHGANRTPFRNNEKCNLCSTEGSVMLSEYPSQDGSL